MFKRGFHLGVLAACNTLLALLAAWYIVKSLGINAETDAFFASGTLPQVVFLILNVTLLPILVPLFATIASESFQDDAWTFFLLITAFFIGLAIILFVSSEVWVPLLVPGFSADAKSLTISLTKIQLINMVLNASIVALWTMHYARQRFVWVEISAATANLIGLLFLFYTLPRFGIRAAVWSAILFNCLKLIFLLPVLGGWRRPKWKTATVGEAWRRFKPLLPGQLYLRADPLLDRFLTSMTHVGGLSVLYVAQQFYAGVTVVLGKAIVAPMVPQLAVEAADGSWPLYRRTYRNRLLIGILLSTLGSFGLLIAGLPALRLVIGQKGIGGGSVETLWLIMMVLAGAFISGMSGQVTSGAFYATGNTKTPTKVSALVYTVYIPLKILIMLRYGLIGLALTMSAQSVVNALLQFFILERTVSQKSP